MPRSRRPSPPRRYQAGLETLERRDLPAVTLPAYLAATGFGVAGKYATIHADAVATDAAGDAVVTGSFRGTVTFGSTSFTSSNTQDTFVARYSPLGVLIWARTFAGQASTTTSSATYAVGQGSAVAIDPRGNVVVAGSFTGVVNFGTAASPSLLASLANTEAFVAKLDSAGNLLWVRNAGANGGDDQANALALDAQGGVVVVGTFEQSATFGATTLTSTAASAAFVARYDAAGNATWAIASQAGTGANAQATGVAVDSAGDIALTGFYSGSITFATATGSQGYAAAGSDDAFVARLDATGRLLWLRSFGSTDYDAGNGVAVDSADDVVVVGTFSDAVNFTTGTTPVVLTAGPIFDAFVLKLDPTGQLIWARAYTGPTGWAKGQAVVVDPTGAIHVAGSFTGPVDFDPGAGTDTLTSVGSTDAFVAGLTAAGTYVYANQAGQTNFNAVLGLAVDPAGNVALAGDYSGAIAFGSIALPSSGVASSFVARLQTEPTAVPSSPVLEAASTTGTTNTTSITVPVFDVTTALATATVELLRDGVVVGQRVGPGAITDPGPVVQGVHRYTAIQVTTAGVASQPSLSTGVTFITTPPTAPTGLGLLAADDSGTAGDGITNVRVPRIVGMATAGLTVRVLTAAGTILGTTTTGSAGTWTITLPSLADGTYSLQAVAVDAAANQSVRSAPFALTILTATPATPGMPALLAADDSGTVGDGITNVRTPRLIVTAAAGMTVTLINAAGTVLGTATTSTGGVYTVPIATSLADGTYAIRAVATDVAGNVSAASPAFTLGIDTTPPAAPGTPALLAPDDSGTMGDGITNVKAPRLTVAAPAGLTVRIFDAPGVVIGTATASTSGVYTVAVAANLADGSYPVRAFATDVAGNAGPASSAFLLTIRTTLPATLAAPTLLAADDSGTVGDGITNARSPRFTVAAGAGLMVSLVNAAGVVLGSAASGAGGVVTVPVATSLADGSYAIRAVATDVAGNASSAGPATTVTILANPPAQLAAPTLVSTDDSGVKGDGMTADRRPRITGTATPGDEVDWINAAGAVVASTTATSTGVYILQPPTALINGTYAVAVRQVNVAGTVGPTSAPFSLTIRATTGDYFGTSTTDVATYNQATATFRILNPTTGQTVTKVLGQAGDVPVTGDFDGDGVADLAVFRPSTATFYYIDSSTGTAGAFQWGINGDVPILGDYDGDGRTDFAVYRPSNETFYIWDSGTNSYYARYFGQAGDIPVPGDYFGNGHTDIAVFRPSTATFYVFDQVTGATESFQWGLPGDIPVPADYDGDGRTDFAVYRPSNHVFYMELSNGNQYSAKVWGLTGDIPVAGDYFGLGRASLAVYRPSNGTFYAWDPTTGAMMGKYWGLTTNDKPIQPPLTYDFTLGTGSNYHSSAILAPTHPASVPTTTAASPVVAFVVPDPADPNAASQAIGGS